MYFGSVKFFKHLIYLFFTVLILTLVILIWSFLSKPDAIKNKTVPVNDSIVEFQDKSSIVDDITIDDIYQEIQGFGFSTEDVLNVLEKNDNGLMDKIFKEHYTTSEEDLDYKNKFPDLYVTAPNEFKTEENTIYLTFDDGPSENTLSILGILDKYNIKATFFVSGDEKERSKEILKQISDKGHSIGVHSYSHKYEEIYQSMDNFLDDFNNSYNFIYNTTGQKPDIFRFAGGSINTYNQFVYQQIIAEMSRRGFIYYDWNASGEDASKDATWTSIYRSTIESTNGKSRAIILLHDGADKQRTVTVVEDLIIALQKKGYKFDKLTHDIKPITFAYID